jgi:hypothetical protein
VRWTKNPADVGCIPWGAGLCVTRPVAEAYVNLVDRLSTKHLIDRQGDQLFCGGDDLFSWVSTAQGQGFGIFPALRVTHLIPPARLRSEYFIRLIHDHALSLGLLQYLLFAADVPRCGWMGVVRILLHGTRRGIFSMRCQWARARGERRARELIASNRLQPLTSVVAAKSSMKAAEHSL